MRRAISWMIHQSWRASPGGWITCRASCTRRSVLVKLPLFSAKAEAGRTTSAWKQVSVRKRSCTTRCSSLASALARMLQIGIRHRGVLALDIHAPDLARVHGVHDLDHGEAALVIELLVPEILEELGELRQIDRLIIGIIHRDQAGIRGALHIVLAAQRMKPGSRPSRPARSRARARSGSAHCRCRGHAG